MSNVNFNTNVPQLLQIIGGEYETKSLPNGIRYALCGRMAFLDGAFAASNEALAIDVPSMNARYILNFATEEGESASVLMEPGLTKAKVPQNIIGKKFLVFAFIILLR